jgi:3-oxosteroid 1-dehydrogenase
MLRHSHSAGHESHTGLNEAGTPIPGLYAAGNTMAAVSGTIYLGGSSPIGAPRLFSHLAALDMANGSGR